MGQLLALVLWSSNIHKEQTALFLLHCAQHVALPLLQHQNSCQGSGIHTYIQFRKGDKEAKEIVQAITVPFIRKNFFSQKPSLHSYKTFTSISLTKSYPMASNTGWEVASLAFSGSVLEMVKKNGFGTGCQVRQPNLPVVFAQRNL